MKKIILNLKVKTISNRGEKLIFNLTREINHRISDKEIEFEFLGYTFSYKKQNTDQMDVFKVTEIISYSYPLLEENLSDKSSLFISQKTNLKKRSKFTIHFGNKDVVYLEEKLYSPISNQIEDFEIDESDGLTLFQVSYHWDKTNLVINIEGDIFTFPKKEWEVHYSPRSNINYLTYEDFYDSYILNYESEHIDEYLENDD
jgi:hypothetical protein